ncbi:MAG: type IV secretory system conjugative DNA transfer family protein [Lachnospiraceae bacterium]|nr:type IV secretory system conjugative DNA transfer family protein [Lachnospiraceae bacterium]
MRKFTKNLWNYGVWISPLIMAAGILYLRLNEPSLLHSWQHIGILIFLSLLPALLIYIQSINQPSAELAEQGKAKAMYPPVPDQLKFKVPTGFVLGKDKKFYIGKPFDLDGHACIIGGSGAGKSSSHVIPTILSALKAGVFAVDIKGELSRTTVKKGDPNIHIINPKDRTSCGWNPFYRLNEQSTAQDIDETMRMIAYSLIPLPADIKDPFWKQSARSLLIGLLTYYYDSGQHDLISIVDSIKERPIRESVASAIETLHPESYSYRYLIEFKDLADETFTGITREIDNHLMIFVTNEDVRYMFKFNPHRADPSLLDEGHRIFLSIHENALTSLYDVIQLIVNQTLMSLEARSEDAPAVVVLLDELPRLVSAGKIEKLTDAVKTLRSRNVTLILVIQSVDGLMCAYTEHEVYDLLSNCSYIAVLSATTPNTQKMICDWVGKYKCKKQAWNRNGKDYKISVSFDDMDIVEPSELMTLSNTGEVVLITPYGYFRVKKVPYYSDPILSKQAAEIKEYNDAVK